jgi:hypothetical protein
VAVLAHRIQHASEASFGGRAFDFGADLGEAAIGLDELFVEGRKIDFLLTRRHRFTGGEARANVVGHADA